MTDVDTLPVLPNGGFGECWRRTGLPGSLQAGPGASTDVLPLCAADAFADAAEQEEDTSGVDYVHIRVQQRNGKKSLTTVQVSWPAAAVVPLQAMQQTDWLPRVLLPAGTQEVV